MRYRTTSWAEYNTTLKSRGPLTVRLDRDMPWLAAPSGKPVADHGRNLVDFEVEGFKF